MPCTALQPTSKPCQPLVVCISVITRWRHLAYFQEAQLNNFFDYTLLCLTLKYLYQLIKPILAPLKVIYQSSSACQRRAWHNIVIIVRTQCVLFIHQVF